MKLNELAPVPGARHARKRLGRGIGSGTGKTAGRGHKGQRARAGSADPDLRGRPDADLSAPAQARLQEPVPHGVTRRSTWTACRPRSTPAGSTRRSRSISPALRAAGLVTKRLDGVRLLARGELSAALTIEVDSASKAAIAAVEKAGGKLILASRARRTAPSRRSRRSSPRRRGRRRAWRRGRRGRPGADA